jgi:fatty acid desaturase
MFAGDVDLNTWYKPSLDRKILKKLSKRSDLKALIHILIFIVLLFITGYFCYLTWGTWWSILWLFLYGNIFYSKSISIQHETNHETFFKSRKLNKIFYHITSIMGGFEQVRWKWSHFHHHSHTIFTNEENYDYENNSPRPTEPIRFLINFLPFGSLLNIQKIRHFTHFEILKHSFGNLSPVVQMTVPEKEKNKIINSSKIHIIFWIFSITLSFYFHSWLPIFLLILPPFYGNTILMLMGLTQHAGLSENSKDHRTSTRTVILNPIFSFLYSHMEYHIEHHIFPKVPCYNLKKLHKCIKAEMPDPCIGLFQAYKQIVPVIFKQSKDKSYCIDIKLPTKKEI